MGTDSGDVRQLSHDVRELNSELHKFIVDHQKETTDLIGRLSVLESLVVGNGRPGIMKMLDREIELLDTVDRRLKVVENRHELYLDKRGYKLKIAVIYLGAGTLIVSLLFNILSLILGG